MRCTKVQSASCVPHFPVRWREQSSEPGWAKQECIDSWGIPQRRAIAEGVGRKTGPVAGKCVGIQRSVRIAETRTIIVNAIAVAVKASLHIVRGAGLECGRAGDLPAIQHISPPAE